MLTPTPIMLAAITGSTNDAQKQFFTSCSFYIKYIPFKTLRLFSRHWFKKTSMSKQPYMYRNVVVGVNEKKL